MKTLAWLIVALAVIAGIYYYRRSQTPTAAQVSTALVDSIKYRKTKDGVEERIVTLISGTGCVRGRLGTNSSVDLMQTYEYHREGRVITLLNEKGSPTGVVVVTYEGLSCTESNSNSIAE